ncbi:protein Transporter, Pam16 [Artemisia annua]|uniref:Protein Transporter, Pam16 n=1 Tax=Artemisia annua TaxID=35608 RepID=A0A2U1Q4L1_ARTAN|nr:protein Transporter, Pam16 [Artemisia annua]
MFISCIFSLIKFLQTFFRKLPRQFTLLKILISQILSRHNRTNGVCIYCFGLMTDASKTGVAQETLQNAVRKGSKAMTEQEARQILGVSEHSSWEEIAQKYDTLFERNAKNGSFYLQSKVHRAKECLETVYQEKDKPGDNAG